MTMVMKITASSFKARTLISNDTALREFDPRGVRW
jgi:hypothetical protein